MCEQNYTMILAPPSPEQLEQIQKIRNENLKTTARDLEAIKSWLLKQRHLPDKWDDDRLTNFLRGCNFSLETCKKKLDMYFTVRSVFPEFFTNRDVTRPELQEVIQKFDAAILPALTPDGKRVMIGRPCKPDFETPNFADAIKLIFMACDIRLKIEKTNILGDVYVLDAGFPLARHFFNVSPMILQKFFVCVQEAWPLIIKEVHVVNAPPFVAFILNAIRPFMSESLRNTIRVHTELETLYEFVPKEILPEDFGGSAGKLTDVKNQWVKEMEEFSSWFQEEESVKSDESKRSERRLVCDDLYGFEGSFKQLNID